MTDPTNYGPLDHLLDEIEVLQIRARRIVAEREARPTATRTLRVVGKGKPSSSCCIDKFRDEELVMRENIDALLAARRADGRPLPLDHLSDQFGLDPIDRLIVVLAATPCIGPDVCEPWQDLAPFGLSLNSPTPELVATIAELDLKGRVELRTRLATGSPLMKSGLVVVERRTDPFPDDWPSNGLRLTGDGWRAISGGLPAGDEEAPEA